MQLSLHTNEEGSIGKTAQIRSQVEKYGLATLLQDFQDSIQPLL